MKSAIFLLANIGVVLAEIVLAPSNTVVVRDEEMKMNCVMTNNSKVLNWDIFTTNRKPFTIYCALKFHRLFQHFGVDVDASGSGILYTNSTQLSDAGIYKCLSTIDGKDKEHSAQLIVLESMPTCEDNFTLNSLSSSKSLLSGDYIWMQCNVSFRGFWSPTIEWIEYGDHLGPEGRSVTEGVEVTRIPNTIVTSNLTIVVNSSRDGSHYVCKIYFVKYDGRDHMTARNIPNFTYIWTSSVITLSPSSPESVSTALDAVVQEPSTRITHEDLERSTNWYFISLSLVAALSVFFVVIIVALYIRFKRELSAKYASASMRKLEMSIRDGDYDISPYATSDNYETIEDIVIDAHLEFSFPRRQGPLPTPGYSGLTQTEPTAPSVYSRMDTYETPADITPGSRDTKVLAAMETITEEQVDESEGRQNENDERGLQPEGNQSTVHPYIELLDVDTDNPEDCQRTSDCDIPSSYLTVNF